MCTPTLNELTRKIDDLGKKDGGFHARRRAYVASKGTLVSRIAIGIPRTIGKGIGCG